jgi:hypothetical protein
VEANTGKELRKRRMKVKYIQIHEREINKERINNEDDEEARNNKKREYRYKEKQNKIEGKRHVKGK